MNLLHYLKFFLFHLSGGLACASLLAGGGWTVAGLLGTVVFYTAGDALLGDDHSTPSYRHPAVLTVQLWMALPLVAAIAFALAWSMGSEDFLGFGAWLGGLLGTDLLAARAATSTGQHVAGVVLAGLMIGTCATVPAHELTHRTWDRVSMAIGRWLLAFSFDTNFSIEHVYGHHRYVATTEDPATAPRGRNVYTHILVSTWKGHCSAWRIESRRLQRLGKPLWSPANRVLSGALMSAVLLALAWWVGGGAGALAFIASGLYAKALLEVVNYMEHYGIVRDPRQPVQPRHSWNTTRRISSWSLFNLTRHSHHHAQGELPYQDLKPMADAPMMINGYLTTVIVASIPPLWHYLMTPKVLAWDRDFATEAERALARQANAASGMAAFQAQG